MSNLLSRINPDTTVHSLYYTDAFATKTNEGGGVAQLIKLAKNILMLFERCMKYLGKTLYLPQVSKAITHLDITCKTLIVNRIVRSSTDFRKTLSESTGVSEKLIYDTLSFAGDILTVSGFFGAGIAKASVVTGLMNGFIDTKNHLGKVSDNDSATENDFNFKCSLYKYVTPLTLGLVKNPILSSENPVELRRLAMLKVLRDIISIATGIIALVLIATGISLVSELALLTVSTLSIVLGLGTKVLEENTSHKVALLNLSK